MESRCAALGIEGQVRTLGYVSDEDVAGLYAGAVALVMPTFFGPTNIPFLEAWSLDCPVLTSRIRGIVEQVGDAAVTVDPKSVEGIADGIRKLWTHEPLRQTLIAKGRSRVRSHNPRDFRRRLREIIDAATERIERERHREPAPAAAELRA
jgi:glycosyltransferase involved in cell wall biosynthesis